MSAFAEEAFAALVRSSLQGAVFIGLVWIICRLFPRLPASFRCGLWWAACLKLLVGLVWISPVELPLLPAAETQTVSVIHVSGEATGAVLNTPERVAPLSKAQPFKNGTQTALAALWLAGLLALTVKAARQLRHTRWVIRRSEPLDDGWIRTAFADLCDRLGLRRAPGLLGSEDVRTPQAVGLVRPLVVLPRAGLDKLSPPEVSMTLCHELLHLRRGDLWWGWVPALAHRIFFFHPLAAMAAREYAIAREAACDAEVIQILGSAPQAYGRLLLRWGVAPRETGLAAAGASPSLQNLKRRLQMLQQSNVHKRRVSGWWWLAGVILLAGLVPLRIVAQEPAPEAEAPEIAEAVEAPEPPEAVEPMEAPEVVPTPEVAPAPEAVPAPEAIGTPVPPEAVIAGVEGVPGVSATPRPPRAPGAPGAAVPAAPGTPAPPEAVIAGVEGVPGVPATPRPPRAPRAPRAALPAAPGTPAPRALPTPRPTEAVAPTPPGRPVATPRPGRAPQALPTVGATPRPAPAPRAVTPLPPPTPRAYSAKNMTPPPAPPAPPAPPKPPVAPKGKGSYSYSYSSDDNGDSWILLQGNGSASMSGNLEDLDKLKKMRGSSKEDILWYRHKGKAYVVRDAATLKRAREIFKPQMELGAKQGALGGRQGELGGKQGALGAKQGALGAEMGALGAEQARRGGDDDQDLERRQEELASKMEDLGRQQEELGRQQETLGRQQEDLGRQQEEMSRKVSKDLQALMDKAIAGGVAQEVR